MSKTFRARQSLLVLFLLTDTVIGTAATPPSIESSFHLLYEMRFEEGRSQIRSWEKEHPEDSLGHDWEAAS